MSLPGFNENGDLPRGIYKTTLTDLLNRFGKSSPKRRLLALRLERIYRIASDTGYLARFIVFGSFITEKSKPNDVDVFMLMDDDFDFSKVTGGHDFFLTTVWLNHISDVVRFGLDVLQLLVVRMKRLNIGK